LAFREFGFLHGLQVGRVSSVPWVLAMCLTRATPISAVQAFLRVLGITGVTRLVG